MGRAAPGALQREAAAAAARKERDSIAAESPDSGYRCSVLRGGRRGCSGPLRREAVAAGLLAAAAATLVLAVFYAGMLSSANDDVTSKESAAQHTPREAEARAILFATCSP